MGVLRRLAMPAALAVAFAVHTLLSAALTGRTYAPTLVLALSAGAVVVALLAAGRPAAAVRSLDRRGLLLAAAGGALAVFGAPALVAANRMSDAPAGSVTVLWTGSGWAAIAAAWGAIVLLREGRRAASFGVLAGAAAALVGGAAVLADWERPSSFSPLIKFPQQEMAMLLAGVVLVAGIELLAAAGRRGRPLGAVLVGTVTALALSAVWFAVGGLETGIAGLAEAPWTLAMAGIVWGVTLLALGAVWRDGGATRAAACLALAPALISPLTWLEQVVGANGPQPMILAGVGAGCLLVLAGALRLARSGTPGSRTLRRGRRVIVAAAVPGLLAATALALPALRVNVTHQREVGTAVIHWVMTGAESVAVLAVLALALLLLAALFDERPPWPAVAALAAVAALPALLDVPTHVIVRWLSPAIQQDYGTEYATIVFTRVLNIPAAAALVATAVGLIAVIVQRLVADAAQPATEAAEIEGS